MGGLVSNVGPTSCVHEICTEYKWGYSSGEFDHYQPHTDHVTPAGTKFDPVGQNISPLLVDRLTSEVEACLHRSIDRTSFEVMIPNDWVLSCDGSQQLLPTPVKAGISGCLSKEQAPTEQCPCRWRAGIRCPNTIICTPNFYLYKDALIRFATGNPNPWSNPELAKCATPSTTPLSDGSDPNNGL